ncbi:MAG: putative 2-aminoethylphosphonate ABC transporter ATP-binding protein [Acetatifactor sp.]|nr:putative 2-aminoethylphosphonate ABC transporter ATP-binding protein [Acetatifactor sp.]
MTESKEAFLEVKHIRKTYGKFTALEEINLTIHKGDFVCMLGPSGCGKTTLLRIIAGLEAPTEGQVFIQGKDVTKLPPGKRNFGIVFQSYALFPNMTVRENIAFGLKKKKLTKKEMEEKIRNVLDQVNLADQIDKYPAQLSGGQQQRIALARALVVSPDFLLLDEPLSALDAKVRLKVRKEIRSLQQRLGITTIMVTHDQEEALTMADQIVVMNNACIMQQGTPVEVYDQPNNPFVADFIGSINFFQTDIRTNANLTTDKSLMEKLTEHQENIKACRPEDIEIVQKKSLNSFNVLVHDIEFHGYGYRLWLDLGESENALVNNDYISVDMSADELASLGIRKGDEISIRFKRGKLHYFHQTKKQANA